MIRNMHVRSPGIYHRLQGQLLDRLVTKVFSNYHALIRLRWAEDLLIASQMPCQHKRVPQYAAPLFHAVMSRPDSTPALEGPDKSG